MVAVNIARNNEGDDDEGDDDNEGNDNIKAAITAFILVVLGESVLMKGAVVLISEKLEQLWQWFKSLFSASKADDYQLRINDQLFKINLETLSEYRLQIIKFYLKTFRTQFTEALHHTYRKLLHSPQRSTNDRALVNSKNSSTDQTSYGALEDDSDSPLRAMKKFIETYSTRVSSSDTSSLQQELFDEFLPNLLGSVPKPDYMLYPLTVIEEGEANDKKSNR